jgi:hypothetical protein
MRALNDAVLFAVDEDDHEDLTITWRDYQDSQKQAVMEEAAEICDFILFSKAEPGRFEGYQLVLDLPSETGMLVYEGNKEWRPVS